MQIKFNLPGGESFMAVSEAVPRSGDIVNLKYIGLNCFEGDRRLYDIYVGRYLNKNMIVENVEWFPNIERSVTAVTIHLRLN